MRFAWIELMIAQKYCRMILFRFRKTLILLSIQEKCSECTEQMRLLKFPYYVIVIDQFGIGVDTKPVDDEHFRATVQIYPSPTFYRWVFGWGGKIKIESPSAIHEEYRTMLKNAIYEENI